MYLGKIGCIRAKLIVFDQIGCTLAILLYSGNLIVFGENLLYFGRIGSIRAIGCIWEILLLLGDWLYLGKIGCI